MQNIAALGMARRSGLSDRVKAILNTNINRREINHRTKLVAFIIILVAVVPLSAIHLMKHSATAMAADSTTGPATKPVGVDKILPPLPERLSSRRIPIQVLSPQGTPFKIDSISRIEVLIGPSMEWTDGPTPEILGQYADGWVVVDKEMFALAQPGQRVDVTISVGGAAMQVTGSYPKAGTKGLILKALYDPKEVGIDTSTGPTTAKDEIAGQVVDPAGKPVAGALVWFPDEFRTGGREKITTGADGVFRFPDFAGKWYVFLQIDKAGYATRLLTDVPIGHGFLVHLDNHTRLKGRLLGPDGSPAANATFDIVTSKPTARVAMANPIPDLTVTAKADDQGQYDIPLEPGEYKVRVAASNGTGYYELPIPSGQSVELPGKLQAGVTLKVVAIDTITNKPAAGVSFYMMNQRPGMMSQVKGSERTTAEDGSVQWDKLTPGPTLIEVSSKVYGRWWTDEMKKQEWMRGIDPLQIKISEGMSVITVHVEPAVHVTGQVLSPTGEPVANAQVDIAGMWTGDARYANRTDSQGNFKLQFPLLKNASGTDDAAVKYAIVASDSTHRWANAVGSQFTPTPGQNLSVTLKMTGGARIRGRVVSSDGKPVTNLEVQGQPADQLDREYYNPRTLTDPHGHFDLGPMRGGEYGIYLNANQGNVGRQGSLAPITLTVAESDRFDVGEIKYDGPAPSKLQPWYLQNYGQPTTSNSSTQQSDLIWRHVAVAPIVKQPPAVQLRYGGARLPAEDEILGDAAEPGELSGIVIDENGKPLDGVSIHVWTWGNGPETVTDGDGAFFLNKLDKNQKVEIRFTKDGYCPRYIPQQPTGLSNLSVVMNNKTYFKGQVKGPDGKPVANAKIRADQGPKQGDGVTITNVWTETTTDDQGNYKLYLQPDSYDIQMRVPSVGVIRTGKTPIDAGQSKHLDLTLIPGIIFHANVVDSITGKPVKGVRLWSWQNSGQCQLCRG